MKEQITLKDIADQLGVSLATVDRAVNGRGEISPETRMKILKKIEEVGYKPNKIARSLVLKKEIKVGVIMSVEPKYFWSEVERGIGYAEDIYKDFGVKTTYYRIGYNILEQKYAIDKLVSENVNVIILKPINDNTIIERLNSCIEYGILIVNVNDDVKEIGRKFYVGPQDGKAGETAGELMARYINRRGRLALVTSPAQSQSYKLRYEGFCSRIRELSQGIEIIDISQDLVKSMGEYNAYFITKHYLQNIPDLVGIYNNSGGIYEIGLALKDEKPAKDIVVIGHEISPEVTELMEQGYISAIISQDPFSQGYYSMKILCEFMIENKEPRFTEYFSRIDIIVKSNSQKNSNIISFF